MARRHYRKPARDTIITVIHETAKTQPVETPAFWSRVSAELGVDRDELSDLIDELWRSDCRRPPMAKAPFKSGFAILDVERGRKKLVEHFEARPVFGPCPDALRIPVVIRGYLSGVHDRDDGTSQEFTVTVESVEAGRE